MSAYRKPGPRGGAEWTPHERHAMSIRQKQQYDRIARPAALWRCRRCGVKVLSRDQAGHTEREHGGQSHGWDMVQA